MRPDVTVIGAGPAGSLAALLLARRGWQVTLIEQHRFPRDKVCGECLSSTAIDVLTRVGLWAKLEKLGAVPLNEVRLFSTDAREVSLPLPRAMAGLSRRRLDSFLLDSARDAGAIIRQPARCEKIDGELLVRDLERNTIESWKPGATLLADGKGPPGMTRNNGSNSLGIKIHFDGISAPRNAIELFGCRGCYGGLAPIEAGRWNAAFSVPATRVKHHKGNLAELLAELRRENPMLDRRLAGAQQVGPILASPLPRHFVQSAWPTGVIVAGNSAAALEPIGGEGMGLAMRSAELAAEVLCREGEGSLEERAAELRRRYRSLWRARRLACNAAGWLASWTRGADAGVRLVTASPDLGRIAMKLIGK